MHYVISYKFVNMLEGDLFQNDSLQLMSTNASQPLHPAQITVIVSTMLVHLLVTAQVQAIQEQHVQVCIHAIHFKSVILSLKYHQH